MTAVTHLLITKDILKLAGICGSCNVNLSVTFTYRNWETALKARFSLQGLEDTAFVFTLRRQSGALASRQLERGLFATSYLPAVLLRTCRQICLVSNHINITLDTLTVHTLKIKKTHNLFLSYPFIHCL